MAYLISADLTGASCGRINLPNGDLSHANLTSAYLSEITLTGADFAGSVSLSSASNRFDFVNNSSTAAGLVVLGTNQIVGNIDGSGATQVNAGSDLTANHIIQDALVIAGTANDPGFVTIDASDADGDPPRRP
jgi:uncharacterized protein YjbI with pentapeptide repeats